MTIFLLTLKVIIDRKIGAPGYGKYFVDYLNARDKRYQRKQMNGLSKKCTTTCESLVMLHYESNKRTVSFSEQCGLNLTEDSRTTGKIGHSKI